MTQPRTHTTRELDRRTGDGIEVRLLWSQNDGHVTVAVTDTKTGEAFELAGTRGRARARGVPSPLRVRGAATASACPDHGLPFVVATTTPRGGSDATPHQHPTFCPCPDRWRSDDVHIPEYQSLARVRAAGGVVLHDGHRSDDRQRLAADDRSRSALQRDQPAMGGDRVRAHVRRLHAARRSCGGPARPPPDPDGRAFVVYGGVAGSRAVDRRACRLSQRGPFRGLARRSCCPPPCRS